MARKVYELTQEGVDKLKAELQVLEETEKPLNLKMLKEAREQGDLSENADYDAARTEQSKIEARISEINNYLKNHKIIKGSNKNTIEIGSTVQIKYIDNDLVKKFQLVSTLEANPMQNKISVESPLGKALIGLEKGDITHYKTKTDKVFQVEIMELSNGDL